MDHPDPDSGKPDRPGPDRHGKERGTLPVLDQPRAERADAARNRRRILDAARRIIATRGVEGLAMEEVAAEAKVGVGTLYRRFGDRVGLAEALLDEHERELQAAFLSGPPPLGPGAGPVERIEAFLHACVDHLEARTELHLMAEAAPGARFRSGAYLAHHTHLNVLLQQCAPDADTSYLADALLGPLSAELYAVYRSRGVEPERIKAALSRLVRGVTSVG